jgi:hypothetical protein
VQWLIRECAPRPCEVVSSVRVAQGDTGFTVAVIVGQRGRALSTEFSPARVHVSNPLDGLGVIPADTHPPEKGTAPCSA